LAVPTQKGSALFWHNLDGESYDYDKRTIPSNARGLGAGGEIHAAASGTR